MLMNASRLSLTPGYFSRVLHELGSHHRIEIKRCQMPIPDVQKLANHGNG